MADRAARAGRRAGTGLGITAGQALGGGTEAYVAGAVRSDGTPAVLKLLVPSTGTAAGEATVLRPTGGSGCVRLLASDAGCGRCGR